MSYYLIRISIFSFLSILVLFYTKLSFIVWKKFEGFRMWVDESINKRSINFLASPPRR